MNVLFFLVFSLNGVLIQSALSNDKGLSYYDTLSQRPLFISPLEKMGASPNKSEQQPLKENVQNEETKTSHKQRAAFPQWLKDYHERYKVHFFITSWSLLTLLFWRMRVKFK